MIASASKFTVFGISMQRQGSRRRLVVGTYAVLALICALASWSARWNSSAMTYVIWAAMLVGIFLFGGQGRYGLIKPFFNRPPGDGRDPIDRLVYADPVLLKLAASANALPSGNTDWKNDERELTRRDRAHYIAYQPLYVGFIAVLVLSSHALHRPGWLPLDVTLNLIYVISLLATVLALTLPAAIILWTEPDLN